MIKIITAVLSIAFIITASNAETKKEKVCKQLQKEYDEKYKKDYLSFKLKKLPKEWTEKKNKYLCMIIGDERKVTSW